MDDLKRYAKYVLWVIGGYLLTQFLVFVGFNATYKNIELVQELPEQIIIEKAEATKKGVRVYGQVINNSENDLNGKYIKIEAYNIKNENVATDFLKIENLKENEQKLFKSEFNAKNAKSYTIMIVDSK